MEIPVYENEAQVGTLRVLSQGLYTVFEARLPALAFPLGGGGCGVSRPSQTEGAAPLLTRLWLLGEKQVVSLGLLEPGEGGRRFRRRFSRLELQKLPRSPWTALILPAGESPIPASSGEGDCGVSRPSQTEGVSVAALPLSSPPQAAGTPSPRGEARSASWLSRPDGSLYDPQRRLLALPWAGGEAPAAARILRLDGREYWVFHA